MTITSKNTKQEILDAYNSLSREHRKLQKEHEDLQKQKGGAAPAPAAAAPAAAAPSAVKAAGDVASIVSGLTTLRASLGGSASALQQRLTAEATRLSGLRQQAGEILTNLRELHQIEDVQSDTLGELITTHKTQAESFQRDLSERTTALNDALSAQREAWEKEQEEHRRAIKERDAELKKQRQREAAEFDYSLKLRRKLDEEAWQQSQAAFEAGFKEQREAKQRAWAQGEEALAVREKEYADLKAQVAAFPAERDADLKRAREEGANIGKRQARIKADLVAKDNEGKRRVFEHRISALDGTIATQTALIADLTTQLRTAQKQAQELAVKAIEGASNESSFVAIKEIALEQAKNAQKSK